MRPLAAGPFAAFTEAEIAPQARSAALSLRDARATGPALSPPHLPLLGRAPLGARFQALTGHRAAAFGAPPGQCPAEAVISAESVEAAVAGALRACLTQRRDPECGCVLLAADDALFAPRAALGYASGVAARFLGAAAPRGLLVAEERPAILGRRMIFRDAGGVLARAEIGADKAVALRWDGALWRGEAEAFGRLRGRLVERWRLRDALGRRITALIGFEPGGLRPG